MTVGGMSIAFVVVMAVLAIILIGLIIGIVKVSKDIKKEKKAQSIVVDTKNEDSSNMDNKSDVVLQKEDTISVDDKEVSSEVQVAEAPFEKVDQTDIESVDETVIEQVLTEDAILEEPAAEEPAEVVEEEAANVENIDTAYDKLVENQTEEVAEDNLENELMEAELVFDNESNEAEDVEEAEVFKPVIRELKQKTDVYQPVVRKLEPVKKDAPISRNRKVAQQDFFTPLKLNDKKVEETKVEEVKTEPVLETIEPVKKTRKKATRTVKAEPIENKAATKPVPKKTQPKEMYVLSYDKQDRLWVIKKSTNTRATKKFVTKEEALKELKVLAEKAGIPYLVQKMDGKFQKL